MKTFSKALLKLAISLRKWKATFLPRRFQKSVSSCDMATEQIDGGLFLWITVYHHIFMNSIKISLCTPHVTW